MAKGWLAEQRYLDADVPEAKAPPAVNTALERSRLVAEINGLKRLNQGLDDAEIERQIVELENQL